MVIAGLFLSLQVDQKVSLRPTQLYLICVAPFGVKGILQFPLTLAPRSMQIRPFESLKSHPEALMSHSQPNEGVWAKIFVVYIQSWWYGDELRWTVM